MGKTKTKKFRGSRTCGGGTHKNRRGAGNRGGRGNAGTCKHHFVRAMQRGISHGKKGFNRPLKVVYDKTTINIGKLDELADYLVENGKAEKRVDNGSEFYDIDLTDSIDKVLGGGRVTKKLFVTCREFSEKAKNKIEMAGGKAIRY